MAKKKKRKQGNVKWEEKRKIFEWKNTLLELTCQLY